MKLKKFILISLALLTFLSGHAHAQGPIYNFNFNNQVVPNQPGPEAQPASSTSEQITAQAPVAKVEDASKYFVNFGFGRVGDKGPFSSGDSEDGDRFLTENKFDLGFGSKLSAMTDLLFNLHYKRLSYSLANMHSFAPPIVHYKGNVLGLSVGPQFSFPLSATINFVTSMALAYATGKLAHPTYESSYSCGYYGYPDFRCSGIGKANGQYRELGAELGLGFDIKVQHNLKLGVMGKYAAYKVDFDQAEGGDSYTLDMVKHSRSRTQAGLNLKWDI